MGIKKGLKMFFQDSPWWFWLLLGWMVGLANSGFVHLITM